MRLISRLLVDLRIRRDLVPRDRDERNSDSRAYCSNLIPACNVQVVRRVEKRCETLSGKLHGQSAARLRPLGDETSNQGRWVVLASRSAGYGATRSPLTDFMLRGSIRPAAAVWPCHSVGTPRAQDRVGASAAELRTGETNPGAAASVRLETLKRQGLARLLSLRRFLLTSARRFGKITLGHRSVGAQTKVAPAGRGRSEASHIGFLNPRESVSFGAAELFVPLVCCAVGLQLQQGSRT
jgi:hypothetical protein